MRNQSIANILLRIFRPLPIVGTPSVEFTKEDPTRHVDVAVK